MARVRLADLNGPKRASLGQNGPKWIILVHCALSNAKIQFGIRSILTKMVAWTILEHFGPVHFPTVPRPFPIQGIWMISIRSFLVTRAHLACKSLTILGRLSGNLAAKNGVHWCPCNKKIVRATRIKSKYFTKIVPYHPPENFRSQDKMFLELISLCKCSFSSFHNYFLCKCKREFCRN